MKIEKYQDEDVVILKVRGEFDTNVPGFQERVGKLIQEDDIWLVFDLHSLRFINSAAVGYLMNTARGVSVRGGGMALARPSKFIQKTLGTMGLHNVFSIYETVEGAVATLQEQQASGSKR